MNRFAEPRGFTLIELLVVLAVAAVLTTLATAALQNIVASNQLAAITDDFVTTLNLARSEAGRLGNNVAVSTTGGSNWGGSGWSLNNGAQTLRQAGPVPAGYTVWTSDPYDDGPVTFDPTGRAVAGTGKFILCQGGGPASGGTARLVLVSASGRVRISQNYNPAGWPLDDAGNAVTDCNPGG